MGDATLKGDSNGQHKLPAFMFYVGDYLKDAGVRSSSLPARGLWTDMLCYCHEGNPRGYLTNATGKAITLEQLSRLAGDRPEVVATLLQELEDNGVFSRTAEGTIFSRRMVRDESKRSKCSEAGKRGGNPTLKGRSKGVANGEAKQKQTPSYSSSISISSPPPTPLATDADATHWREVEEELDRLQVALKTKAITTAKANGCTPNQVLAWICWLNSRPGRYQKPGGVIYNRMTNPDAVGWADEANWPEANGSDVGSEPDRYKPVGKTAQQSKADDDEARIRREKFQELERLNAPFISVLDEMTDEALEELVANDKVVRKQWITKGRDSPEVRLRLLTLLRERELVAV